MKTIRAARATLVVSLMLLVTDSSHGSGCPGDFDSDGTINASDLAILLGNWGGSGAGDINGDAIVDAADLAALLGSWGECHGIRVTGVDVTTVCKDTIITITGSGMGTVPDDLCCQLVPERRVAARVLTASDTVITARVGDIPAGATQGQWMIVKGDGLTAPISGAPTLTTTNAWAWSSALGAAFGGVAPQLVTPIPEHHEVPVLGCIAEEGERHIYVWSIGKDGDQDRATNSQPLALQCLQTNPCTGFVNWPQKTSVTLDCHFDIDCGSGAVHYDVYLPTAYVVPANATAAAVASALAQNLVVAFNGTGAYPFTISAVGPCIQVMPNTGCKIIPNGNYGTGLITQCPPAWDNCSGAKAVFLSAGFPSTEFLDTFQASSSLPFPASCSMVDDVWFKVTLPGTAGTLEVSTCGAVPTTPFGYANFDTLIEAFGSCGGASLGCFDDNVSCSFGESYAAYSISQGTTTIWVRVGGKSGSVYGSAGHGGVEFLFN